MKTSCGATLIASQVTDTISVGSGAQATASAMGAALAPGIANAVSSAAQAKSAQASVAQKEQSFDDRYKLIDKETGAILAHTEYAIRRSSGAVEHGVSDSEGNTHILSATQAAEDIDIYV
jgi:hypothetical protein